LEQNDIILLSKRSLKILIINWQDITNPFGGGAEVHLHEIFKRVVGLGHEVTLLCCKYKNAMDKEVIDGIRIFRKGNRSLFNFYVPLEYKKLVKIEKFDIVLDDLNKIPFYSPLFVKGPIVGLVHHFFGKSIFLQTNFLAASYVYFAEKMVPLIYRNLNFAAVSQSTRNEMKEMGLKGQISLLPNAVDVDAYKSDLSLKSETPLIGYLGRLKKYKSVNHILDAFCQVLKDVPNAMLLIVGDGDFRAALEQHAVKLNIQDNVHFSGFVSFEEKVKLLNQMWVAVNPSPKEGWGLTVIEANACGVPVIAADSPGLRDSVVDKETGHLYQYGNIKDLAKKITRIIQDKDRREKLSENSIQWAQKFDWDSSAKQAVQIIEKTIVHSEK
jgi:glycosyltransferase involved in cell wall biosynthesis